MKITLQHLRNILLGAILILVTIYLFTFTLVSMPARSNGSSPRALVLKWFHKDKLQSGDLVWVELENDQFKAYRSIRRILRVYEPDPSERPKALGRRLGRQIAQAILDMDFKPTYAVTALDATNQVDTATQWRMKGIVIHVFGRPH